MNSSMKLQVVDEKEAAQMMKRAIQTLRNDRHLRRGCPYLKIGKSVRYLLSDINEFLLNGRIDPNGGLN